jgi:transposase-like protein
VAAITEKLCGLEVTSAEVGRAVEVLDAELEAWRSRPLGETPYPVLDARYEKVRHGGSDVSSAMPVAIGIDREGKWSVLGTSVSLSEAEVHWRDILGSLQARGLHGVRMVTSDAHAGLKEALKVRMPGVPWQRCQFHLIEDAMAFVPKPAPRAEVAASLRDVFDAPTGRRLSGSWIWRRRGTARLPRRLSVGWRRTCPRASPSSPYLRSTGSGGRAICRGDWTRRSRGGPGWRASSPARRPPSGWLVLKQA